MMRTVPQASETQPVWSRSLRLFAVTLTSDGMKPATTLEVWRNDADVRLSTDRCDVYACVYPHHPAIDKEFGDGRVQKQSDA